MIQEFRQFVYCNDNSNKNYPRYTNVEDNPSNINKKNVISGEIFEPYAPFTKLGIQAPPGTKFYINNGINPVIVGSIGSISIDFSNGGEIEKLRFSEDSIKFIEEHDELILIVDTICDKGGA